MIKSLGYLAIRNMPHRVSLTMPIMLLKVPKYSLVNQNNYSFAKISKKDKEKQKSDDQKKKVKEELGDISSFDLNPFEEKYKQIIEQYKQSISHYKIGRLDPNLFANIFVRIGNSSFTVQQLAQIAPKSANTCVLNPFDHENLESVMRAVQGTDYGFQVTKVQKTILITQPQNSAKELKQKLLVKLKKGVQVYKQKINKVRTESRDGLKKYEKVIPKDRLKNIET